LHGRVCLGREYLFQIASRFLLISYFPTAFFLAAVAGELRSAKEKKRKDLSSDFGILDDKVRKCIIVHSCILCSFLGGRPQLALASPSDNLHACAVSARITVISNSRMSELKIS